MTEIKSTTDTEPLFDLKNFFRPTSQNVLIWGTVIKGACATIIATGAGIVITNLLVGLVIIAVGLIGGLVAEAFVLFTKQTAASSLKQSIKEYEEEKEGEQIPPQNPSTVELLN